MLADELSRLDATAQAALVRKGEIAPIELIEATIAGIERLNPQLNAVVTKLYDAARRAARQQRPAGPFGGVPFLLKDSAAPFAGVRMTSGSHLLADHVPVRDGRLVVRLKRAGLIVLGKTNCAEFGLLPATEPELFGPTRNPWNPQHSAGGSSGGSAAAVAAGMVPMAHGSDGGGSIRIPAACCGVFGLKPSRGRVPLEPGCGAARRRLVVEHALTRSVRDSAALLDATCAPDIGRDRAPLPTRPFLEEVGVDPGRLRIAFGAPAGATVHCDCLLALQDAAKLCGDLGHELSEAQPRVDHQRIGTAFAALWARACTETLDSIALSRGWPVRESEVEPATWALYQTGRHARVADYRLALAELKALSTEMARFFLRYDLWLAPVLSEPPPLLGALRFSAGDPLQVFRCAHALAPTPGLCNVTGQPAMSVPLYWNAQGLPIGSHFAARAGDDATLFRLGAQLEQARPWAGRLKGARVIGRLGD